MKIIKVVRNPIYADAVEVNEKNFGEVAKWCRGSVRFDKETKGQHVLVNVTNPRTPRQTKAYVGDKVLSTVTGFKVYTPTAFANNFKIVDAVANDANVLHRVEELFVEAKS